MAQKSKWRIGGRKQSTSSGESGTTGTITPTDSEGQELAKTSSRFMRSLGFGSSKSKKNDSGSSRLERPFTQQNLEHQKLLNTFAWNFGRRRPSQARSSISGISPSASRNASIDSNYFATANGERRETHPRFSSSLAYDAPQEVSGEDSDREQPVSRPGPEVGTVH